MKSREKLFARERSRTPPIPLAGKRTLDGPPDEPVVPGEVSLEIVAVCFVGFVPFELQVMLDAVRLSFRS
jgi:hypothetical protein